jgi:hypothetical protein
MNNDDSPEPKVTILGINRHVCQVLNGNKPGTKTECGDPASVKLTWGDDLEPLYMCCDCYEETRSPSNPSIEELRAEERAAQP